MTIRVYRSKWSGRQLGRLPLSSRHWFLATVMAHMIRVFLSSGYRRPRQTNWLIGVALFALAIVEGLFGNCPTTCCPAPGCG